MGKCVDISSASSHKNFVSDFPPCAHFRELSKNALKNKKKREKQREKKAAEGGSGASGT